MSRPPVAITMGDAAGIGPEIVARVLADGAVYARCRPLVIGAPEVMAEGCRVAGAALAIHRIDSVAEAAARPGTMDVLAPPALELGRVTPGRVDAACGRAAALCLAEAFRLAGAGQAQAVVAAPMNKEAFHLAGYPYLDELEYLADITGSEGAHNLAPLGDAWVTRVTEHVPFRDIAGMITRESVLDYILRLSRALAGLGYAAPRLAVAALNAHAGEGGQVGREEIDAIAPAIAEARRRGLDVAGPVSADAVFVRALAGQFDGVVAMYHDQANIPRKMQPMGQRVTLFMGLPVPCATTGHGTAFDIAGKGIADPGSLRAALDYALLLSRF